MVNPLIRLELQEADESPPFDFKKPLPENGRIQPRKRPRLAPDSWTLFTSHQDMNVSAVLSGQMKNGPVERNKHQSVVNGQAEEIRVRDLFVPVQTMGKRLGQGAPAMSNGVIMVTRMFRQGV